MRMPTRSLLILGCAVCTFGEASAGSHSEKTFLTPRSPGVNLPIESTAWYQQVYAKPHEKMSSSLQGSLFYQQEVNNRRLGKYFGVGNGSNTFTVGPRATDTADVFGDYIIHNYEHAYGNDEEYSEDISPLVGTVTFKPKHEAIGFFMTYLQDLGGEGKGAYFKVLFPIVSVRTSMGMHIKDEVASLDYTLTDFFKGDVSVVNDENNLQSPLEQAKIHGHHTSTGLSDVDVQLGYRFYQTDKAFFFANLGAVIPASNKPDGEWAFEPQRGNNGHFGIGAGFDGGVQCWSNDDSSLRFLASANYRYLVMGHEIRTLSLKTENFSDLNETGMGQYLLVGELDQVDVPLFPAANILTQSVKVTPGSNLDATLSFALASGKVLFDLGYNFFWKDKEHVRLRTNWEDDMYGIANANYSTGNPFGFGQMVDARTIASTDIKVSAAATPSYITNKIFTSLGYTYEVTDKYPCLVKLGGSYEFASSNNALENWSIWASTGITF